ncbi:MAG: hypothetical protein MUE79_00645 [Nitratireductor sp.]|jgi:hypothetical protein|nr:hypothetical protein [Nitratireductor sp.]
MKRQLPLLLVPVLLSACQKTDGFAPIAVRDNSAAVAVLQKVNASAQDCWRKDKEFRGLRVIPELDTVTGKPRILLVEAKSAQGLPKLVIEAEGKPAQIASYGPLAQGPLGARINSDVSRWAGGNAACQA